MEHPSRICQRELEFWSQQRVHALLNAVAEKSGKKTDPQCNMGVLALADQTDENMWLSMYSGTYREYDTWETEPSPKAEIISDRILTGFYHDKSKNGSRRSFDYFHSRQPHGIRRENMIDKNPYTLRIYGAIIKNEKGKVISILSHKIKKRDDIAANVYTPGSDYDAAKKYPAIVVAHPNGREAGYITLAADCRLSGPASGGEPRHRDNPAFRTEDIHGMADFISQYAGVDKSRVGALGICGGGGYTLKAAQSDKRLKAIATLSMFNSGEEEGKEKVVIRKGEVVKCPVNVPHWHGASADTAFVQVAITGREKGETVWLKPKKNAQCPWTTYKKVQKIDIGLSQNHHRIGLGSNEGHRNQTLIWRIRLYDDNQPKKIPANPFSFSRAITDSPDGALHHTGDVSDRRKQVADGDDESIQVKPTRQLDSRIQEYYLCRHYPLEACTDGKTKLRAGDVAEPRDRYTLQGRYTDTHGSGHAGDDRGQSAGSGENILINPKGVAEYQKEHGSYYLVSSMYGVARWQETNAVVTIKVPGNPDLENKLSPQQHASQKTNHISRPPWRLRQSLPLGNEMDLRIKIKTREMTIDTHLTALFIRPVAHAHQIKSTVQEKKRPLLQANFSIDGDTGKQSVQVIDTATCCANASAKSSACISPYGKSTIRSCAAGPSNSLMQYTPALLIDPKSANCYKKTTPHSSEGKTASIWSNNPPLSKKYPAQPAQTL
ncbi:hypothetical protein FQR65_LT15603 [Abscondita terminalis]|nr:hypothetical protein FQR65_LT15603 [Abscondita terminalis]